MYKKTRGTNRKATVVAATFGGFVGTIGTGFNALAGIVVAGFTGGTTYIVGR